MTSSVFVAEVREAPDVAQPDRDGDAGEEEVERVVPRPPIDLSTLRMILSVVRGLLSANFMNIIHS